MTLASTRGVGATGCRWYRYFLTSRGDNWGTRRWEAADSSLTVTDGGFRVLRLESQQAPGRAFRRRERGIDAGWWQPVVGGAFANTLAVVPCARSADRSVRIG